MTLVPPGAQLDLPPPLPHADPREPSPATHRGRGASTPRKVHSPQPSRGSSPVRPSTQRAPSSDATGLTSPPKASSPPLISPTPRTLRAGSTGVPITGHPLHSHSLSRPVSPAASIHSSTSAIFERDIELPPVASLTLNPNSSQSQTLNHKSSRLSHLSHGSNLDHTVPAVLDDAVEALSAGTSRGLEGLEIESPAPTGSGMARQPSSQAAGRKLSTTQGATLSRSPSPMSIPGGRSPVVSPTRSPPILGQISTGNPVGGTISPIDKSPSTSFNAGNVPRPAMPGRMSTGPQVPGAWSFGNEERDTGRKEEDKVSTVPSTAAIAEVAPAGPETAIMTAEETSSPPPPIPGNAAQPGSAVPSHLTPSKDKRRISFISYNDLLLSVPTTVTHLGEITSGQLSPEHLPGTVSPNISRSPAIPSSNPMSPSESTSSVPQIDHKASWDSGSGQRAGLGFVPASVSGEGEWSREGLGKGLGQRLEDLVQAKTT